MNKLPQDFYQSDDVVDISRKLLGKKLCTFYEGQLTSGIIIETEAYSGRNDKACHAHANHKTPRNRIMFSEGGHAYVYLCYGIHHLFNVVANTEGNADAVLVRALQPVDGLEIMKKRRNDISNIHRLCAGPGMLSQALNIGMQHYGLTLWSDQIWIEDVGVAVPDDQIVAKPRIGVDYAGEDALLPWRFYIAHSPFVSHK